MNAEDFPDHLRGPWGKFRGYCARLALVLHCLRLVTHEAEDEDVDGDSLERAAKLVSYFQSQARKVYSLIDADPRVADARRALRWLQAYSVNSVNSVKGSGQVTVSKRELHAALWGGSRSVDDVDQVLSLLLKHGYLRPAPPEDREGPGRRPSPVFETNPYIREPDSLP
jgi:hypothetical protein